MTSEKTPPDKTLLEEFKEEADRLYKPYNLDWIGFETWGVLYIALCNVIERRGNK